MRTAGLILLILALAAPAFGQSAIASWDAVTLDVLGNQETLGGYHIYYGTTQGGPYPLGQATGNVLTIQIDNLQNGQTYYFVVKAIDAAGNESAYSNEASYTVPYEICDNGIDDDHDGKTDCQDPECATPPPCAKQLGVCVGSVKRCGGAAGWLDCTAQDYGSDYENVETKCDGKDNDCDGQVDNGLTAPPCLKQLGVCAGSVKRCGGSSGWLDCTAQDYGSDYEDVETKCDNKDNDCNGQIDEGLANCCNPTDTRPCSKDVGECHAGTETCDSTGTWGACSGVLPQNEVCDGKDNDCDGQTDIGLTPPPCAKQQGVCAGSVKRCGGAAGWLDCTAQDYGSDYEVTETRCDGKDNNCDGVTDEGCGNQDGGADAGQDAGQDAGHDAGPDAGGDSGADNGSGTDTGPLPGNRIVGSCGCGGTATGGLPWLLLLPVLAALRRRR